MKAFVIVACICIVLTFLYLSTCVWAVQESLMPPEENFDDQLKFNIEDSIVHLKTITCDSFINEVFDRHDEDSYIGNFDIFSKSNNGIKIKLSVTLVGTVLIIQTTLSESECIDYGKPIHFIYSDGSITSIQNTKDHNCDGKANAVIYIPNKTLDSLSSKPISQIKIYNKNTHYQGELNEFNQALLQKTLNCLAEFNYE